MILILGVKGAIEVNVFLSSVQASVNTRVAAQVQPEYTLNARSLSFQFKISNMAPLTMVKRSLLIIPKATEDMLLERKSDGKYDLPL